MKSFRKIIFVVYIIFAILLFVQAKNKAPAVPELPVRIISDARSYVLPKTPVVSVVNTSASAVTIDTCKDISVIANGAQKASLPPSFCRVVEIPSGQTVPLFGATKEDIQTFQSSFAEIPKAELRLTYTPLESTSVSEANITIKHAGFFRLFFRTIFYNPVYNLFAVLILVLPGNSLGWAIIILTLIIRLALLLPQQKMLVSQRRMQNIQPKIKAIQEEHKGDQAAIGAKMMELYKREGVNPLGSCLPLLIQIPILIVLYQVILNISSPTNFAHLYDFAWLQNFQNIALDTTFFGMHLTESHGIVGITLGLLTGGLQFGQMWLSQMKNKDTTKTLDTKTKEPGVPDMQQMQKVMIYVFPLMAAYFAYKLPAGLGLYWLIGTIFMICQQWVANRQTRDKKMTIRDKAGNVIN